MTLIESALVTLGSSASDFSLEGADGKTYELDDFADANILVVVFMCNHCPYVQAVWDKLVMLQDKYQDQGVQFVGINPNTAHSDYRREENLDRMAECAEEYDMNFPYLDDADQEVAREYDAQCTPDIFVYNYRRELVYHGRVDDARGNVREASRYDLDDALEALVKGKRPSAEQFPSMGCSIKWAD